MTTARKGMFGTGEFKSSPTLKSKAEKCEIVFTYGYIQVNTSEHEAINGLKDLPGEVWKMHVGKENDIQKKGYLVYATSICQIPGNTFNLVEREQQINKDLTKWKIDAGMECEEISRRNKKHITPVVCFKAEIKDSAGVIKRFDDFASLHEFINNPHPAKAIRIPTRRK